MRTKTINPAKFLDLIAAAQALATNAESGLHAHSYSGWDAYGVQFLEFYAKTTMDIQVSVRIKFLNRITIATRLDCYYDENGVELEEYKKFGFDNVHDRSFEVDEFLDLVKKRFDDDIEIDHPDM